MRAGARWVVVVVCSVAVFRIALEITIISVALPEIELAFSGSSTATVSWVFTGHNIGVAALLLVGGWLAERHGRKRVFLSGLWIFAFGSLASGLAPSLAVLIAARMVQAVGASLAIPASLALILHVMGPKRQETAVAVWGAMAGLAAAIGPTVGAILVETAGWRWVFWLNVPVAVAAAVLASKRFEESSNRSIPPRVDLVAVPTGAVGVGLLVFAIVMSGSLGWTDARVLAAMGAAVVLVAVFARRSVTHHSPVFDPKIAKTRSFSVAGVATVLFVTGFTAWLVMTPALLADMWGYSTLRSGLAIAPAPLMIAVTAGPAGRWAASRGHRVVVSSGALLSTTAVIWWAVAVEAEPDYVVAFLPGTLLFGIGVGLALPMLTAAVMRDVAPDRYAMGAAGNTTARQVAMAVGIAVAVALVGTEDDGVADVASLQVSGIACGAFFVLAAAVIWIGYPEPARARRWRVRREGSARRAQAEAAPAFSSS